jgi:lipopolysaccharide transport system permease protein
MSEKIIVSNKKQLFPDFNEIIRYKDLFFTLAWRDFRVRYAQTTIGLLWALLQPVITLLILTLVFGTFIAVKTPVPHLLFTLAGMSIWTYFSYVMTNAGSSIISSQDMIKKIYFPRIIIPFSKALVGLIDFSITLLLLVILMIYYGISPTMNVLFAPLFLVLGILAALGMGIWLSALTVRYRDFQHVVPFLVQIGLYLTPIAYPSEYATIHLPKWAASLYYLNPMAGIVQGFRWSLFGGTPPNEFIWITVLSVLVLFISGLLFFKRIEDEMADLV